MKKQMENIENQAVNANVKVDRTDKGKATNANFRNIFGKEFIKRATLNYKSLGKVATAFYETLYPKELELFRAYCPDVDSVETLCKVVASNFRAQRRTASGKMECIVFSARYRVNGEKFFAIENKKTWTLTDLRSALTAKYNHDAGINNKALRFEVGSSWADAKKCDVPSELSVVLDSESAKGTLYFSADQAKEAQGETEMVVFVAE